MCSQIVSEEYKETMQEFWDITTLSDRLRDTESVAVEYKTRTGSWNLARIIVKKRNADGSVRYALYVVRKIDKEKQKECRDKVKEASGFLLDLVNNILDMNKLESGAIALEHKPFDLLELLGELNALARMNAEVQGLQVTVDHTKIRHCHVLKDCMKEQSVAVRWGGDEFLLITPNCSREEHEKLLEQIQAAQSRLSELEPGMGLAVGGMVRENMEIPESVIMKQADQKMYENKKSSR